MQGLAMVFIEAPVEVQQRTTVPDEHWAAGAAGNVSDKGNAAGNTEDLLLDLTGQNKQFAWLPAGFTARGTVTIVFSCISAVLGLGFITYYGMSGLPAPERAQEKEKKRE